MALKGSIISCSQNQIPIDRGLAGCQCDLREMHERNAHNFPLNLASTEVQPVALKAAAIAVSCSFSSISLSASIFQRAHFYIVI